MKNQFIFYELALKLKNLGFKDECMAVYTGDVDLQFEALNKNRFVNNDSSWVSAPLWQQAFDWFRSLGYESHILSSFTDDRSRVYFFNIEKYEDNKFDKELFSCMNKPKIVYNNHDEARKECLKKLIDIYEIKFIIDFVKL